MKPHNLLDFLQKAAQSKAARQVDDNVYRVPVAAANKERKCTPYQLPPAQANQLMGFATTDCWMCKGTGIKGWRNSGLTADVCKCVKQSLEKRQQALEAAQQALLKRVEEQAKEEIKNAPSEARPTRKCEDCPTTGVCPKCAGSKIVRFSDEEWLQSKVARMLKRELDKQEG